MAILVTGASGFLGRHVLPRLHSSGVSVLAPSSRELDLLHHSAAFDYLARHADVSGIVHLAANYGGLARNIAEPATMLADNTLMLLNLLRAAAANRVPTFLTIGSACGYTPNAARLTEEMWNTGPCHDDVLGYGEAKRFQIAALQSYEKQHGLRTCCLVMPNLYGEHDDFSEENGRVVGALVARCIRARDENSARLVCWGDGSALRDFLHASDAADAIAKAVENHAQGILNVGSGRATSIHELVSLIADVVEFRGPIEWDVHRPTGAPSKILNCSRAHAALQWHPRVQLRAGLERTVAWYLENAG